MSITTLPKTDSKLHSHCQPLQRVVFQKSDSLIYAALTILSIVSTIEFWRHWFSAGDWLDHPATFALASLILLILFANQGVRWMLLPAMRKPAPLPAKKGLRVAVVTAFVPGAEPLEMLDHTLRALVSLEYPHDTWVLDEGDDKAAKEICEGVGACHFTRKHSPQYLLPEGTFEIASKHGNYNAWLAEVGFDSYDVVSAFDIDHVPDPGFLMEVLGYFEHRSIGYVQAAQAYYNQNASFIARGAAEETFEFYSILQMASYRLGHPTVIGCHNTHRIEALRQVGGFAAHAADDLLITLLYQHAGWEGVYVPKVLARGLVPVDWNGYLTQQRRWARSVLDIKLRRQWRLMRELPLRTRCMSLLHGLNYLQPCLLACLSLALLSIALTTGAVPTAIAHPNVTAIIDMLVALIACHIFRQRFYLERSREAGIPWHAWILRVAKWPFILAALIDVLSNRRFRYEVTIKSAQRKYGTRLWRAHALGMGLIVSAWIAGALWAEKPSQLARIVAVLFFAITGGIIATEYRRFPHPFDLRRTSQGH